MKKFKTYIKEAYIEAPKGQVHHFKFISATKGTAQLGVPYLAFGKNPDKATLDTLKIKVPTAKALTKLKADPVEITHTSGKGTVRYKVVHVEFSTSSIMEATIAEAKITGELYKRLETACKSVIKSNGFDSFSALHAHYKKMGIGKNPSVRARWDVFNAIHSNIKRDLVDDLYKVGNDTHIDTALKTITGIKESVDEATEGPPTSSKKTKEKHDREKTDLKRKHDRESETAREKDFRDKETKRKQEIARKEADKRTQDSLKEYLEDGSDELVSTYKKDTPGQ